MPNSILNHPLISQRYALDQLPQAFADMEAGAIARGVITFD